MACAFCAIVEGAPHHEVWRDEATLAFLDRSPLFPGHTLLVPLDHFETIESLPEELVGPLFLAARRLSAVFASALGADGSFVAVNTRISQSVPHVHVHIVPRRKGDGLFARDMVWKRYRYREGEAEEVTARLRAALAEPV